PSGHNGPEASVQRDFFSSSSPAQAPFLPVGERSSMYYKHGFINGDKVNDLKIATRARLSPNQPLLVIHLHGIGLSSMVDDEFGFFHIDVVLSNLVAIPLDPPEFVGHAQPSTQRK